MLIPSIVCYFIAPPHIFSIMQELNTISQARDSNLVETAQSGVNMLTVLGHHTSHIWYCTIKMYIVVFCPCMMNQ